MIEDMPDNGDARWPLSQLVINQENFPVPTSDYENSFKEWEYLFTFDIPNLPSILD